MNKYMLTQLSIDVINNPALSLQSKGLYMFLSHGHLPEPEVSREFIVQHSKTGKTSTTTSMRELMDNGYLKKIILRNQNKTVKCVLYKAVV